MPPEFTTTNTVVFYIGFVYVILALLFLFYPKFPSTMRPMTFCFAAFVSLAAVRLLLVSPYANFLWNTTAVESSGRIAVDLASSAQAGIFFVLWDMLNSQYYVGGNPSTGGEKLTLAALSGLVSIAVFVPTALRGEDEGRPPADFFASAAQGVESNT